MMQVPDMTKTPTTQTLYFRDPSTATGSVIFFDIILFKGKMIKFSKE